MRDCPLLTVDIVILYRGGVVVIKRKNPPFQDKLCLPGGFVDKGETVEWAAIREAKEETSLDVELVGLAGVFSDPARDPRGHAVSVAFLALAYDRQEFKAADDALELKIVKYNELGSDDMGFDHYEILQAALKMPVPVILLQICGQQLT